MNIELYKTDINKESSIFAIGEFNKSDLDEIKELPKKISKLKIKLFSNEYFVNKNIIILNQYTDSLENMHRIYKFIKFILENNKKSTEEYIYDLVTKESEYFANYYEIFILKNNDTDNKNDTIRNIKAMFGINNLKSYSIQTPSDINIIYNIRWEKRNLPSCICSESLNSIDPHYNCNYSTLSYYGINLEKSDCLLIYNKDRKNDLKEYFNIMQEIKIYNSDHIDYNDCSNLENYIIFDLLNISKEEKEDILKEWFDIINSYINECGYFDYDFDYEGHASYNHPTLILLSKELVDWDKGEFINKFINSNSLTFSSFKSFALNQLLKR